MKGIWGKVTLIVIFTLILATPGFTQDSFAMKKFDVVIKVVDENDEPVRNVECTISDPGSGIVVSGFTNNGGVAKLHLEREVSEVDVACSTDTHEASDTVTLKEKGTTTVQLVLRVLACIPPTCDPACGSNGTCVADDVCICDDGFHGEFCTVPDCTSNDDCDDGDSCTQEFCRVDDGVCAFVPIPGCDPDERCTSNADCDDGNVCTLNFCDSIGNCQYPPAPEGAPCDDGVFCSSNDVCNGSGECRAGPATCGPGNACDEQGETCQCNIVIDCAIGFEPKDTDGDGCPDACIPTTCESHADCADDNACTEDFCRADGTCGFEEIEGCCTSHEQCSDGDACTADFCRADGTCGFEPIGGCDACSAHEQCNDNDPCTSDFCRDAGICGHEQVPGCTEPGTCESDTDCEVGEICGPNLTCDACLCPEIYDPVCGIDGITYANSCDARCAHVEVAHEGECPVAGFCGDGITDPALGEECDSDGLNTTTCDADCTLPVCGDGFTNQVVGEACDDGNQDNSDSCPDDIGGTCQNAFCGDGFVHNQDSGTEQCDDGNRTDGDGCSANCTIETSDIVFFTEQELFRLINDYRSQSGVDTLLYDPGIASISRLHSEDMASTVQLNPNWSDGTTFSERLISEGVCSTPSGTTVAFNSAGFDAELVFQQWRDNPSHNAILLHTTNLAGIGIDPSGNYYTASFCFE